MTVGECFPTWRDALDYACAELQSEHYRDWGWATIEKHDDKWWALIA